MVKNEASDGAYKINTHLFEQKHTSLEKYFFTTPTLEEKRQSFAFTRSAKWSYHSSKARIFLFLSEPVKSIAKNSLDWWISWLKQPIICCARSWANDINKLRLVVLRGLIESNQPVDETASFIVSQFKAGYQKAERMPYANIIRSYFELPPGEHLGTRNVVFSSILEKMINASKSERKCQEGTPRACLDNSIEWWIHHNKHGKGPGFAIYHLLWSTNIFESKYLTNCATNKKCTLGDSIVGIQG